MTEKRFVYSDGREINKGDRIVNDDLNGIVVSGIVEGIFFPGSDEAQLHGCPFTGGVLLKFDNGDLQLWTDIDEHLILEDCKRK